MENQNFGTTVYSEWIKAEDPRTIMNETIENVYIWTSGSYNVRLCTGEHQRVTHTWRFAMLTSNKQLHDVALMPTNHKSHFHINFITDRSLERPNDQEWLKRTSLISATSEFSTFANDVPDHIKSASPMRLYIIEVGFTAIGYGTFTQCIAFGFNDFPVLSANLCADCVPERDIERLDAATAYMLSQKSDTWNHPAYVRVPFESSVRVEPRDICLKDVYPCPDKVRFFLTHGTLTENRLTPFNYRQRLHELLYVEELARQEQLARYNEIVVLHLVSSFTVLQSSHRSTITKFSTNGELFAQLPLGRELTEDTKSGKQLLRYCNRVYVRSMENNSNVMFEAQIENKANQWMYLKLSSTCVTQLGLQDNTCLTAFVYFSVNRLPFCELHRAIDCLLDTSIVFPSLDSNVDVPYSNRYNLLDHRLNPNQQRAIGLMMYSPKQDVIPPILLLGPYGTGKTFTIAHGLRSILIRFNNSKVLLCTHSNSAADLYITKYFDPWYQLSRNNKLKPLRIYYKERTINKVPPMVRKYCLFDANGNIRDPIKRDIENSDLIVTTMATSIFLKPLGLKPTYIVIDEAAQVMEAEALIPLSMTTNKTRLIFAGDPQQLTPDIYSDLARECHLGLSLLERLNNVYPFSHSCKIQLWLNYYVHPNILRLTSDLFYFDFVCTIRNLPAHPVHGPMAFYSVYGTDEQNLQSTGYFNDAEVHKLVNCVIELIDNWPYNIWGPYSKDSIVVVAHYNEQVIRIRNEFRRRRYVDVNVDRILNLLGKQFTCVFISTVRTRNCNKHLAKCNVNDYGFLTNPKLLNTTIARARSLVAVVGDPIALQTIGSCQYFWQRFLRVATYYGEKFDLKQYLNSIPKIPFATSLNPFAQEFIPSHTLYGPCIENFLAPEFNPYIVPYNLTFTDPRLSG